MNKKLVAVVAAVLVLAGCTAAPSDDGTDAPDTSSQRSAPEETSAPVEPELTDAEVLYLEWVNSETVERLTPGKTDAEMLAAGWAACDQFAQGAVYPNLEVIDGLPVFEGEENRADVEIAGMASQSLCTDYDITVTD